MKYFISEDERKELKSTCFIEFMRGSYEGNVWNSDSICMDEELFYDLKFRKLFSSVLEQFDYFGVTGVSAGQFEKLKAAAKDFLPETLDAVLELSEWLDGSDAEDVLFSIIGM